MVQENKKVKKKIKIIKKLKSKYKKINLNIKNIIWILKIKKNKNK